MIKNFLFDMDGTLIDCKADEFIPVYVGALKKRFGKEAECEKIIRTIVKGAEVMVKNDGTRTNREMFMEFASNALEYPVDKLESEMTDFYETDYAAVKCVIKPKPEISEAIKTLKNKGYRLIVTTNPLFPLAALRHRLEWGGYDPELFDFVTSYETSTFAKPNPKYYDETIERLSLDRSQTIIVGNDFKEDVCTGKRAGMLTYYLTDAPIPDEDENIRADYEGDSADFLAFAQSLPNI